MASDLRADGVAEIEATREAQEAWMAHVHDVAQQTVFRDARSWYSGYNIEGKPRVFSIYVGGYLTYGERIRSIARNNYEGFSLRKDVGARPRAGMQVTTS